MAYGIFAMTVHLIHCTFYTALRQGFCVHLCCIGVAACLSWPTMATTRGPCSTTLATRTSSTRSGTPKWRPTDSRTFGGIDDDGGRQVLAASYSSPHGAAPPSITSPQTTARASSACALVARSQYRPPSSAGSACAWTIAFRGNGLREPGVQQALPSSQPGARSQPLEPPSFREETQSHSRPAGLPDCPGCQRLVGMCVLAPCCCCASI